MSLSESIVHVMTLKDLRILSDSIEILVAQRRRKLLEGRKARGELVGFIQPGRKGSPDSRVECNAIIEKFHGKIYCICQVMAPMKFASRQIKIDMALLTEPFQIVERVETELAEEPENPQDGEAGNDPLGGAFG